MNKIFLIAKPMGKVLWTKCGDAGGRGCVVELELRFRDQWWCRLYCTAVVLVHFGVRAGCLCPLPDWFRKARCVRTSRVWASAGLNIGAAMSAMGIVVMNQISCEKR